MSTDLIERLLRACVAGCNCNAKSPDIKFHDPLCHYRLHTEAASLIAKMMKELEKDDMLDQKLFARVPYD